MWENFPALHKRIISILGEDVAATQAIAQVQIYPNQVLAEVYERYDEPPANLKKKGKDCIRFELFLQPTSIAVSENRNENLSLKPIKFIDETNVEFGMGKFNYYFVSKKITFHAFQTLSYAKVVDNNFGRMLD